LIAEPPVVVTSSITTLLLQHCYNTAKAESFMKTLKVGAVRSRMSALPRFIDEVYSLTAGQGAGEKCLPNTISYQPIPGGCGGQPRF
jgi:hypothetical protein